MLNKTSDLHMHLSGSVSMDFLAEVATKNKVETVFEELQKVRRQYDALAGTPPSVDLIWQQFALIHKILLTLNDIHVATINAIANSKASYLEIRTTPKALAGKQWQDYVDTFIAGLIVGNNQSVKTKVAYGILSLDRTLHDKTFAMQVIDRIVAEQTRTNLLVGVDISGNPVAPRKLSGADLAAVLQYALSQSIGVAVHLGEVETAVEKAECDTILEVFSTWQKQQPASQANPFHGKVRLGHGIYLSAQQQRLIKDLQIPIEICPTCHEKLHWWQQDKPHPVTAIYQFWQDPVVSGTDDEIIFGANAEQENLRLLRVLQFKETQDVNQAREHQAKFRFVK
jgi:adenosine deaminase